jgi:hypothetical protein
MHRAHLGDGNIGQGMNAVSDVLLDRLGFLVLVVALPALGSRRPEAVQTFT